MLVTTILTIVVLNIFLPTADVFTDINLAIKLYKPQECVQYQWSDIDNKDKDDENKWTYIDIEDKDDEYQWSDIDIEVDIEDKDDESIQQNGCRSKDPHHKMATVLLIPFLLNYIVCFYTFFRLTTNRKKYTFIFPLLNLYPQHGKTHSS